MTASINSRNGWGSLYPDPDRKTVLSGNGREVRAETTKEWTELNYTDENLPKGDDRRVRIIICFDTAEFMAHGPTQAEARRRVERKVERDGYKL